MEPFEIYIAYISWGNDGKNRPVLTYVSQGDSVKAYPITTKYENKSDAVKANYFKINDLKAAGLDKQSYIDSATRLNLPVSALSAPIGKLTDTDKERFVEFLEK